MVVYHLQDYKIDSMYGRRETIVEIVQGDVNCNDNKHFL